MSTNKHAPADGGFDLDLRIEADPAPPPAPPDVIYETLDLCPISRFVDC